jgi:hypothetical protein
MVTGLDTFAEHFGDYADRYVLIGGAAAWLVLDEAGINPRATRDLDIVLCIEALDAEFAKAFWQFVKEGQYEIQEKSEGSKIFYRFRRPGKDGYPAMLELFSRRPDELVLGEDAHLTPIPIGEDVSSLSAILLEQGYYEFLRAHTREIGGVSVVSEVGLIPLKAKAWLDLSERKADDGKVDSKDVKKHRADVVRLYQLREPDARIDLPDPIKNDLERFLDQSASELTGDMLKQWGIGDVSPEAVVDAIRDVYGLAKQ